MKRASLRNEMAGIKFLLECKLLNAVREDRALAFMLILLKVLMLKVSTQCAT